MARLNSNAAPKESISKPSTIDEAIMSKMVLRKNSQRPNVNKVTGKVSNISIGFTNQSKMESKIPRMKAVVRPCSSTPGKKEAVPPMARAKSNLLAKNFNISIGAEN
jgi:hypothetical protein